MFDYKPKNNKTPESGPAADPEMQQLKAAISKLPSDQGSFARMKYVLGMSDNEIQAVAGIGSSEFKSLQANTLRSLMRPGKTLVA